MIKLLILEHRTNRAAVGNTWIPDWLLRVYGRMRCSVAAKLYRSGVFMTVSPSRVIASYLGRGDVYVDVGCADGEMCCVALGAIGSSGSVYGFDGRAEAIRFVRRMAGRYGLCNQVHAQQLLIGARSGKSEFFVNTEHPTSSSRLSSWVEAGGSIDRAEVIHVEMVSMDDWAVRNVLRRLDLLKIDVEGAEGDVIRGALSVLGRFRPVIVMEVSCPQGWGGRSELADIWRQLSAVGYGDCFAIRSHGLVPIEGPGSLDRHTFDVVFVDQSNQRHSALISRLSAGRHRR
jgi:FkbM family methyltransferase